MLLDHSQIAPSRITGILGAAEAAARAVPPAFPLEATVAVNPFLGQTGEDLATASARLARVAGIPMTRPRAAKKSMTSDQVKALKSEPCSSTNVGAPSPSAAARSDPSLR